MVLFPYFVLQLPRENATHVTLFLEASLRKFGPCRALTSTANGYRACGPQAQAEQQNNIKSLTAYRPPEIKSFVSDV